ncbi:site-specific integrase [Suicoccus acidiformans]|nr:site-specific integrase [Suicoccus acidiformans]
MQIIDDDYREFMHLTEQHMRPDVYRCLYMITFGLRRGEAYGLTQRNIRFLPSGHARLDIKISRTRDYPEGKSVKSSASNRIVVVNETVAQLLNNQITETKSLMASENKILGIDDFIFISPVTKQPYHIKTLNDWMQKIGDMMEITITPHMFRHTFASYASALGIDNLQLQRYLGHSDIDMTAHYTKGLEIVAEIVLNVVDGFWK